MALRTHPASHRAVPVIAAIVVGCVLGCTGPPAAAPVGGPLILQIGTAQPPGRSLIGPRAVARGLYTESLVATGRDGRVGRRLSDRWEWSKGGAQLKLHVPPTIFHDGTPLTARLAADLLRKAFAEKRAPLSARDVSGVSAPDDETLVIDLRRPNAFLLDDLADVPLILGETVATGPFMLEGGVPATDKGATLVAFDKYRSGRPAVDRIVIKQYPTLRAAWTAMWRGDINMLHEVSREAAQFVDVESNYRVYPFLRPYTYFVAFNMRHPVLGRREVRQALSHAVDRAAIVRDAMQGRGEVADGPIWKYHWAYSTALRTYQFNPEVARLRLDGAGLREPNQPAAGAMSARFRFKCLMFGGDPRFERVALVLQKQLYDIGVDMEVEALPLEELAQRMESGNFDAFLLEMIGGRSLTATYQVWHSDATVFNASYTTATPALERMRKAVTDDETRAAVSELQQVLYDDPPALFLAWPQTSRAVAVDVAVPGPPQTDIMGRISQFRRAETARTPQQ